MSESRLLPKAKYKSDYWVDEAIWGHRLHDEQTPWFIILEFLNVYVYFNGFAEEEYNSLLFAPKQRMYLRNILFNFPFSKYEEIRKEYQDEDDRWRCLEESLRNSQEGLHNPDFSYLRENFEKFNDFLDIIKLVHGSCLELNSNKRWTSKFVFPFCEEALYDDLSLKDFRNDRRFLGRTGELLYLMLCRSTHKHELKEIIDAKIFSKDEKWSAILKALQPPDEEFKETKPIGFLPYEHHERFDKIAEDWLKVLKQDFPHSETMQILVNLTGLHILLYQQELSREVLLDPNPSYIVAEILAPKKNLVRELSIETYQNNNVLSLRAIERYIENIFESEEWVNAEKSSAPFDACKDILVEKVFWPKKDSNYDGARVPGALKEVFKQKAKVRHRGHVASIHREYGRHIGLISKRGTNRLRYAPTDSFLKSLVLAHVVEKMELGVFLELVFEKYNIAIGDRQAEIMAKQKDDILDKKAFQDNSVRLEQRLSSIGLLKRLSDACAYVLNPYSRGKNV